MTELWKDSIMLIAPNEKNVKNGEVANWIQSLILLQKNDSFDYWWHWLLAK